MIKIRYEKSIILSLYILFVFGGIWHLLGVFQYLMRILASPLLIAVSILLMWDVLRFTQNRYRFLIWCFVVFLAGWVVEYSGIHFGFPFGDYTYHNILQPQIGHVPIAIGFAWVMICLSSIIISFNLIQRTGFLKKGNRLFLTAFGAAILMVFFDIIMEEAATKIGYWSWSGGRIPLSNYVSWFVLGFIFSLGLSGRILSENIKSTLAKHVYISQIFYFVLIIL